MSGVGSTQPHESGGAGSAGAGSRTPDCRSDGAAALEWAARYLERVPELPVLAQVNVTAKEVIVNKGHWFPRPVPVNGPERNGRHAAMTAGESAGR